MTADKTINLDQARKDGTIDRFCDEHPSVGDEKAFDDLLGKMVKQVKAENGA